VFGNSEGIAGKYIKKRTRLELSEELSVGKGIR